MKRGIGRNTQRESQREQYVHWTTGSGREIRGEIEDSERKRDVEGLGVRVETCHVCIEREKKKILCSCVAAAWLKNKMKIN